MDTMYLSFVVIVTHTFLKLYFLIFPFVKELNYYLLFFPKVKFYRALNTYFCNPLRFYCTCLPNRCCVTAEKRRAKKKKKGKRNSFVCIRMFRGSATNVFRIRVFSSLLGILLRHCGIPTCVCATARVSATAHQRAHFRAFFPH